MRFPSAAAIEMTSFVAEPVTEDVEEEVETRYGSDFNQPEPMVVWYTDNEEYHRFDFVSSPEVVGDRITGQLESGTEVAIRPVTASDAVDLSPAGVPQPVDVVEAHVIQGGGMLAGEMDAAVAGDNSVATLVLDTGLGLYVRYSGDWQLLPETSSSLENLSLHPVEPAALDIYDAADAAAQTVSIFDLPRTIDGNYYTDATDQEEQAEVQTEGPTIAAIESRLDLSNASRMSRNWYTAKRERAMVPGWGAGQRVRDQVITAAAEYLAAMHEGINADPQGLIRRDIIRRARDVGVLNHPTVVAAVDWRDWLHPRDRQGKFVDKAGLVNIFSSPTPGMKEEPVRGRVKELTQRGVLVELTKPNGDPLNGETRIVSPKLLEEWDPAAKLDLNPAEGGEEGKAGTLAETFPQGV